VSTASSVTADVVSTVPFVLAEAENEEVEDGAEGRNP
jgi:hypothetical protein